MAVTVEEKQTRIVIFSKAPAQHSNTQCLRPKKIPDSRLLRIEHVPLSTRRESNAGEKVEKRKQTEGKYVDTAWYVKDNTSMQG